MSTSEPAGVQPPPPVAARKRARAVPVAPLSAPRPAPLKKHKGPAAVPFVRTSADRRPLDVLRRMATRLRVPFATVARATLLVRLRTRAVQLLQRWAHRCMQRQPRAVCVNDVDPITQDDTRDVPRAQRFVVVLPGATRQYCTLDALALGTSILATGKAVNWVTHHALDQVELARLDRVRAAADPGCPSVRSGLAAAAAKAAREHEVAMVVQAYSAMLAAEWEHVSVAPFALDVLAALDTLPRRLHAYVEVLHEFGRLCDSEARQYATRHAAELVNMLLDSSGAQGDEIVLCSIRNALCGPHGGPLGRAVFCQALEAAGLLRQPPPLPGYADDDDDDDGEENDSSGAGVPDGPPAPAPASPSVTNVVSLLRMVAVGGGGAGAGGARRLRVFGSGSGLRRGGLVLHF